MPWNKLIVCTVVLLLPMVVLPLAMAQDMDTVITTPSGREFRIDSKTTKYTMENVSSDDASIMLIPIEGQTLAHASIKDGTEITKFAAKKIVYYPNNENFLLEGSARIDQGKDWMAGPVNIEFNAKEERMTIHGTKQNPAEYRYSFPDGRAIRSKSVEVTFWFETVDGTRRLKRVEG